MLNSPYKLTIEKKTSIGFVLLYCLSILFLACVDDRNFNSPKIVCDSELIANATYAQVKALYIDQTFQIQDDLVIEGYVISSDKTGNFFSVLHIQDAPVNPTEGFQIEIDVRDTHLFYPVGSKIFIKLKGLYLGKSKGVYKLGGVFTSFGNTSVGRLPASIVNQHILNSCNENMSIVPTEIILQENLDAYVNTLVKMDHLEVVLEQVGLPFAIANEETQRTLLDCNDKEISLLNSGYADFRASLLPQGSGTITALLQKENNTYYLVVNDENNIDFSNDRCQDFIDEFTSNQILITEIADPENNAEARFIELYNAATTSLSLKGWKLTRYTNANTEVSHSLDLSAITIEALSTLVIANNSDVFETVYGFPPDMIAGTNSAADSNGDDTLVLVDPFGAQIDIFGVIGEDGSGTNHEFEDGRAVRKPEIVLSNPNYTFSEWLIFNDTGSLGTINLPQMAPEDFNPKIR